MMEFPVNVDFFPSLSLTLEDIQSYQSLAEQSVTILSQLVREDQWKRISESKGLSIGKCHSIRSAQACLMLCASVYTTGTVQEVLEAIGSSNTAEYRKSMAFLHPDRFEDAICLQTLPPSTKDTSITSMIKWAVYKDNSTTTTSNNSSNNPSSSSSSSSVSSRTDYCYLEQTGIDPHSHVGYCIQESIPRDREVPPLYGFGLKRQQLHQTGYMIQPTDRDDVVHIFSIFQMVTGTIPSSHLEKMMIQRVSAVQRIALLLDRRRLSRTPLMAKAQWVKDEERRHCAVCLKLFALRRKHHCRHCGEVVCSVCAPPREVDVGSCGTALVRVCTACVLESRQAMKVSYTRDQNVNQSTIGKTIPGLGRTQSTPESTRPTKQLPSQVYRRSDSLSLYSLYAREESRVEQQKMDAVAIAPTSVAPPLYPSSWASSDSNFSIASPRESNPCFAPSSHNSLHSSSSSNSGFSMEEDVEGRGYSLDSEGLQSFSSSFSSVGYSFNDTTFQDLSQEPSSPCGLVDVPTTRAVNATQGLMLYVPETEEDRKSVDSSTPSNGSSSSLLDLLASIRDIRADLTTAAGLYTTNQVEQEVSESPRESFSSWRTRPRSYANTTLMMATREDNQVCDDMALITSDSFNLLEPQPLLTQRRSTRTSSLSTSSLEEMEEQEIEEIEMDGEMNRMHGLELAQLRNHIDALRCSLKATTDPQQTRQLMKHHVEMMERELEAVERKQKPHALAMLKKEPPHDPVVKERQQVYHALMEELHEIMGLPTLQEKVPFSQKSNNFF